MNTVRCPACRGAKKVPKLGGMIGECNTCVGKGTILGADKPVRAPIVTLDEVISKEMLNQVADSVPSSEIKRQVQAFGKANIDLVKKIATDAISADVKVDGKKAIYRRKKV